eukprot:762807-Hanusia_phi.AAC.3
MARHLAEGVPGPIIQHVRVQPVRTSDGDAQASRGRQGRGGHDIGSHKHSLHLQSRLDHPERMSGNADEEKCGITKRVVPELVDVLPRHFLSLHLAIST